MILGLGDVVLQGPLYLVTPSKTQLTFSDKGLSRGHVT